MQNIILQISRLCQASSLLILLLVASVTNLMADERFFTYSYEAEVLPQGGLEFEQWLTAKIGRQSGNYTKWVIREELEYGLTDRLTTALYLNFEDTHSSEVPGNEDEDSFDFAGISSEWKYQLINPNLNPVGLMLYGEAGTNGEEAELEGKLIISSNLSDNLVFAFNATYEPEWEFEGSTTHKELNFALTAGLAYKLTPNWAIGLEALNHREFPGGFDFNGQEHSAFFVGPNVHYGSKDWWATFTVMPQVYGNGEGAKDNLQLAEHERVEARLIFGIHL